LGTVRNLLNAQLVELKKQAPGLKLSQQEADALASLGYNAALFKNKALLDLLKTSSVNAIEIVEHLFDTVKTSEGVGGFETGKGPTVSQGLIERRIDEARIFLRGEYVPKGNEATTKLGTALRQEREAGTRQPAVDRVLNLPKFEEKGKTK
jgi:hypothetical protein